MTKAVKYLKLFKCAVTVFAKHSKVEKKVIWSRTCKAGSYRSGVGNDHAFAFFCILLPLQLLPLKHISNLLFRHQGFATP